MGTDWSSYTSMFPLLLYSSRSWMHYRNDRTHVGQSEPTKEEALSSGILKPNKAAQRQKMEMRCCYQLPSYKIPAIMKLRAALELYLTGKRYSVLPEVR